MTGVMWRRRSRRRASGLLYALSPASRGRLRPGRRIAPRSRTASRAICSWRSPPVSTATRGLPLPSTRRWIVVENPPCERPSASPPDGAGPAGAGGVLMGANDGGIDKVQAPGDRAAGVGLGLQGRQNALPDPGLPPAVEPARHRSHRPIAFRQVAPRRPGAVDPQDAVHDPAIIMVRSSRLELLWRQHPGDLLPLLVCQLIASHTQGDGNKA